MGISSSTQEIDFNESVNLSQFKLLRVVGRGAFGKVRIVKRRDSDKTFALKYINKEECCKSDCVRNIVRERNLLEHLDHPFVCNLRFAFQDDEYMYMVLDLMLGGDLRFHLNRKNFTESAIRIWISELSSAIHYLHSKGICHRDIKPDNILLDDFGHVHLTDFNVASIFDSKKPMTSKSGTMAYIAPEMLKQEGYGPGVDFWSLGVVFFECVYGKRPFQTDDTKELKNQISKKEITYPEMAPPISSICEDAIRGFLERSVEHRLGCGDHGFTKLKQHPFFQCINWDDVETKRIQPIFIPNDKNGNFDDSYNLEELLLETTPLESHSRKVIKEKQKARQKEEKRLKQLEKDRIKNELNPSDLNFESKPQLSPIPIIEKKLRYPNDKRMQSQWDMIEEKFKPFDYTLFEKYQGFIDPNKGSVGDPPSWVKPVSPPPNNSSGKRFSTSLQQGVAIRKEIKESKDTHRNESRLPIALKGKKLSSVYLTPNSSSVSVSASSVNSSVSSQKNESSNTHEDSKETQQSKDLKELKESADIKSSALSPLNENYRNLIGGHSMVVSKSKGSNTSQTQSQSNLVSAGS